jgi:hypothetical protein
MLACRPRTSARPNERKRHNLDAPFFMFTYVQQCLKVNANGRHLSPECLRLQVAAEAGTFGNLCTMFDGHVVGFH